MKSVIITFIIAFLVFEFFEHAVLPLFWVIKGRNKRSNYGMTGMIGKVVEVKQWDKTEGKVLISGELWKTVCEVPLTSGDKAVTQDIEGLTMRLKPYED